MERQRTSRERQRAKRKQRGPKGFQMGTKWMPKGDQNGAKRNQGTPMSKQLGTGMEKLKKRMPNGSFTVPKRDQKEAQIDTNTHQKSMQKLVPKNHEIQGIS